MNVFDNELVLEADQGSVRFRDVPMDLDKCLILYSGIDPNGNLFTLTGSVAFGPSGSWENISPGGAGSVWQLIGTATILPDGFIAPNEFWVDVTQVGPGPTGREVTSVSAAILLADVLFPAGVAITIRLREGQDHVWPSSTLAPTRDITIYAEGQVTGEGVDETVSGRLAIGGAGVKLGLTAIRRRLTVHNLSLQGILFASHDWDVVFRETTFTGFTMNANQGGGVGSYVSLTFDRCTDDGAPNFGMTKSLRIETANHAPAGVNRTRMLFLDCDFHPVVTVVEPLPFLAAGNSDVKIERCSFTGRLDVPVGLFSGPAFATNFDFVDLELAFSSPAGLGQLFSGVPKPPVVRFLGACRVSVTDLFGSAVDDWSIGAATASGPLLVEHGRAPRNPFPGLVMSDENLYLPADSGLNGSITRRVFSRHGLAFTGGRKVYGSASQVGIGSGQVTWHTPTILSAPTTTDLPIANDRVVRVTGRAVARRNDGGGLQWAAWTFTAVIQKTGGLATFVVGPTIVAEPFSAASLAFDLTLLGEQLQGKVGILPPVAYSADWVVELVFLPI